MRRSNSTPICAVWWTWAQLRTHCSDSAITQLSWLVSKCGTGLTNSERLRSVCPAGNTSKGRSIYLSSCSASSLGGVGDWTQCAQTMGTTSQQTRQKWLHYYATIGNVYSVVNKFGWLKCRLGNLSIPILSVHAGSPPRTHGGTYNQIMCERLYWSLANLLQDQMAYLTRCGKNP